MRRINRYSASLGLIISLNGCNNALYFYETEKVSLTAEARPDSSQPVQGSLGIKQRVALVSPRVKKKEGDSLSVISDFNFKITPEPGTPLNPVLIQTAFITGKAAADLGPNEAANAAQAIALDGIATKESNELARRIVDAINNDTDRNTLKEITKRDFDTLTDQDYKDILRITGLDRDTYTRDLHEALRSLLAN